ncbi:MAG: hypothetical protein H6Q75_835 [Firmicutes bacterium]|nr:hypothetical protein [Bacillota bacterium]
MSDYEKLKRLNDILLSLTSAVVAFSGGVDSTFLAAAAQRVLKHKVILVTACSDTSPVGEILAAESWAAAQGFQLVLLNTGELNNKEFTANSAERCYHCKKERFTSLTDWAKEHGYAWVIEGSNLDDLADYRPGMKAIKELEKVRSPLLEAGLTKAEIRALSKAWGLITWNKPSAACLVSRLAYGMPITSQILKQVDLAETLVRKFCPGQVRVRHHGNLARVEVEEISKIVQPGIAQAITQGLKELGFTYVTVDMTGYRTGSMNDVLS